MSFYLCATMAVERSPVIEGEDRPVRYVKNKPIHILAIVLDVIVPLTLLMVGIFGSQLALSLKAQYAIIGVASALSFGNLMFGLFHLKNTRIPKSFLISEPRPEPRPPMSGDASPPPHLPVDQR